jgi:hypothetical protein
MTAENLGGGPPAVRAIVNVNVGGGKSVPVLLDTGSPGLRLLPSAIGSGATVTRRVIGATFGGGETFVGRVATARVTIGSLTTPSPIGVQVIQQVRCPSTQPKCNPNTYLQAAFGAAGAVGLMGIDTSDRFGNGIYSPLLQLSSPYSNGFSLKLAPTGSGTLTLGSPPVGPGTVTAPLTRSTAPTVSPNGGPAYKRNVNMCWSAGGASRCAITDFDIGTPSTIIPPKALPNVPTATQSGAKFVAPGTSISVRTPGGSPVWSYTASPNYGNGLTQISSGGGAGFNTGIVPFYTHTIGWNVQTGQIVISPS